MRPDDGRTLRRDRRSPIEKILARLDTSGAGCWEWPGARAGGTGYGLVFDHQIDGQQRFVSTHRSMYEHVHGPIPEGMVIMHTCDNPPCCNPDHLRLGTISDNMQDAITKGRHRGPTPLGPSRKGQPYVS